MTHHQIIKKAITRALSKGWRGYSISGDRVLHAEAMAVLGEEEPKIRVVYIFPDSTINYSDIISARLLVFNHSFARSFWGERNLKLEYEDGKSHEEFGGSLSYIYDESAAIVWEGRTWKYHLQQMVLEEDPIKYLEQFLT